MKIKLLTLLLIILGCGFSFAIIVIAFNSESKLLDSYKNITMKDELFLPVVKYKTYKGAIFITLEDDKKIKIWAHNFNYDSEHFLDKIITKGDTLYKKENSDTIFLKNGNKNYYYLLHSPH